MIYTTYDQMTPLGLIRMSLINDELVEMSFVDGDTPSYPAHPTLARLLDEYFNEGKPLSYPVRYQSGTPFQQKVWDALLTIPLGETRTYQEVATMIGNPKAIRAVGQACKANPIGLVIPCHRVIGADGTMTGYSGKNFVSLKEKLLKHEKAI